MTLSVPVRCLLYLLVFAAVISEFRDLIEPLGPAGKIIKLVPDMLSGLVLVVAAMELARRRVLYLPPKYLLVGLLLVLHFVAGAVANSMPPDTVVAGIRNYLKYVPLFLLPVIVPLSDREVRWLLYLVLALMLMQVPISVLQRLFISNPSGDVVRGTMGSGAIMSIALISTIGVLFALHLRGWLGRMKLLTLVVLLFLPATINETKGTVILLPLAILPIAFFHGDPAKRLKRVVAGSAICLAMLVAFAAVFNYMYPTEEGGIVDYFLEGGAATNVYKQKEVGEGKAVGRIDSVLFAWEELKADPMKLVFGLGIGNVSDSLIPGEYAEDYKDHGVFVTTYSALIWEVGVMGILLSLVLLGFIAGDAARLRADPGFVGAFALGWVAVCLVMFVSMIYKDLLHQNVMGYLFMLLSGVIVSRRVWLDESVRLEKAQRNRPRDPFLSEPAHASRLLRPELP